jgi:hypothetical protein
LELLTYPIRGGFYTSYTRSQAEALGAMEFLLKKLLLGGLGGQALDDGLRIILVLYLFTSVKEAPTSYIKHCKVRGTASA